MGAVIKIENLSKQYRLGVIGTGTISHDINRFFAKIRGKEDPFLKVGEVNDRAAKGGSNLVWALKDLTFEVKQGEILGIIGKNGAGKSTLLKLLSKVTGPTTGSIKVKGRIASLLEVGTGFHPELTGRENVFLNGAILGMTKSEIASKLDEIVDFSGCAKYIDTPVKRYSSGMMVRLGFAVAAHLEPEILIVDEVLAVGDAEFQKKCIGKMKEISGKGRTVLFVSHNMASINNLCDRCIFLDKGQIAYDGGVSDTIDYYLSGVKNLQKKISITDREDRNGLGNARFTGIELIDTNGEPIEYIQTGEKVCMKVEVTNFTDEIQKVYPSLILHDSKGERIFAFSSMVLKKMFELDPHSSKFIEFSWDKCILAPDNYMCELFMASEGAGSRDLQDQLEGAFALSVQDADFYGTGVTNSKLDKIYADYQIESL